MSRRITIKINGDKVEIEVDGARGKECMDLTEFLLKADGVTVDSQYVTRELAEREVPVEVEV